MKKIPIFGFVIVVIFMVLAMISCSTSENETLANLSPDDVAEKLLNDIFTVSYDEYVQSFEHTKSLSKEESQNYFHRDDIFKDYFTEDGYRKFINRVYNLVYFTYVLEDKFDITVKSIDLDMRDTSDENTKICYFTVEYELIFMDEKRESITMSTDGEMTLVKESNTWLINFVGLKIRQLNFSASESASLLSKV